jgi:hypothetical protein
MKRDYFKHYAVKCLLTNGKIGYYPYKTKDPNAAKKNANNRANVQEALDATFITEAQYQELLKHLPPNPRDTSKRLSPS